MHILYLTATSHDSATRCLLSKNSYHSAKINKWLNNIWLIGTPSNQWDKPHWRSLPSTHTIDMILILVIFRRYSTVTINSKHMNSIPKPWTEPRYVTLNPTPPPRAFSIGTSTQSIPADSLTPNALSMNTCLFDRRVILTTPLPSTRCVHCSWVNRHPFRALVVCYLYLHCLCCNYYCYQPVLTRQCFILLFSTRLPWAVWNVECCHDVVMDEVNWS